MAAIKAYLKWWFEPRRFFVGFCLGWSVAFTLNTLIVVFLF